MDRYGQCQVDLGYVFYLGGYRGDSVSIEIGISVREYFKIKVNYFKYKRKGFYDIKGQDKLFQMDVLCYVFVICLMELGEEELIIGQINYFYDNYYQYQVLLFVVFYFFGKERILFKDFFW